MEAESSLRQRKGLELTTDPALVENEIDNDPKSTRREDIVWGKTPNGDVFRVPTTQDVLTSLFHPLHPKSHLDILNLTLLALQLVVFFILPTSVSRPFFLLYFAFWRAAYNLGLGWVLTKQSKKKWIVREVQRRGWLDPNRRPLVRDWVREELAGKMGKDYNFDDLPLEYNTWLLFRQLVDIILINDFLAYCMFAFACFRVPENLSALLHVLRWIGGLTLIGFNLWVKMEAHHIVKDYGWYWGDVFFERGALVFDGVFEMAPHPMYSVGYAGYYGLSMIVGSYPVLFASLAAHAAQFAFLVFFENPHIERMYGQRKPIALRTPLFPPHKRASSTSKLPSDSPNKGDDRAEDATPLVPTGRERGHSRPLSVLSLSSSIEGSTPAITDGDTESEAALHDFDDDNHTEVDPDEVHASGIAVESLRRPKSALVSGHMRSSSGSFAPRAILSQHDLMNRYFRKDALGLTNLDILRASDFKLVLLVSYALLASWMGPTLSTRNKDIAVYFIHALAWRCFHSFGLGLLLRAQSESKFLVRHYLKNYHYPSDFAAFGGERVGGPAKGAVWEAFNNWKEFYNLSLCMTYASYMALAWRTYTTPSDWTVGDHLLRHTLGLLMVGLHVWTAMQSYEVLGVFGWFFGDFFLEDYPAQLEYTGIYRFLNNPERTMSGAAFFGLSLISGSKLVFSLAVFSQLSHWWFLSKVENPHMQKLYGDSLRKEAGLTKTIKNVALKNARRFETTRAGRHAPQLQRVAQEVRGTFEKVFEETAEVVEDFLAKSAPKVSGVVQDAKVLLQQSRERLLITSISSDLSSYDSSQYSMAIISPKIPEGSPLRFHLGQPITIAWQAPPHHSRKDWVGIYRLGANNSALVTRTNSFGMWVPIYDEEWDGDVALDITRDVPNDENSSSDKGEITFKGDKLPWVVGKYEVRYHHDEKYNVMSMVAPIEIYVEKPTSFDFDSVHLTLRRIVRLCLDSDPELLSFPHSPSMSATSSASDTPPGKSAQLESSAADLDDFRFWSTTQAKRISTAIEEAFGVEYSPEVITADANVSTLTNRILASREMFSPQG